MKKARKEVHLYHQNYLQKSVFLLNFQGFEPNKKRKPRKEEHFYQNLQGFKRRKMKNPKKAKKNKKKENTGLFFLSRVFSHPGLPLFEEKKTLKISDHSTFYDHKSPVPYMLSVFS